MMGGGDGDIYCTPGSTVSNLQIPSLIILRISINFCHIRFARIITTNIGFWKILAMLQVYKIHPVSKVCLAPVLLWCFLVHLFWC